MHKAICMGQMKEKTEVALLTGGSDKPYVFGLTMSLLSQNVEVDVIGSEELDLPEFRNRRGLQFLKLRGRQHSDASIAEKVGRVSAYYAKLITYAATANAKVFHILWNNRFETFDRTVLMAYYRALRKKVVLTAHNVNAAKRDGRDGILNRATLRIQYRLAHKIFVHTEKMKEELSADFNVRRERITVIPFGINNAVPHTDLTPSQAKRRLGLRDNDRAILSFGRITPYKGLEYLIAAFRKLLDKDGCYRLIIAGRVDRCEEYWRNIRYGIKDEIGRGQIIVRDEFVPDDETEIYFKGTDILVLSYTDIYQSGVMFLGQSFGMPIVAADVGSLKEEIAEGWNGFTFKPRDVDDLTRTIARYFTGDLYANLNHNRERICNRAEKAHSWDLVGQITANTYSHLLWARATESAVPEISRFPFDSDGLS